MDPQDKKTKDYSILGQAEDRAISHAKYKREMGINPKYKTEQNVEVSRSAKSMKNPTQRPYDAKTSPKELADKLKRIAPKGGGPVSRQGKGFPTIEPSTGGGPVSRQASESPSLKVKDAAPPKPKLKPERKAVGVASDKSRLAPKMTNFQRMKARQFEKEGVAGRSMTAAQAKRKATEKGSSIADLRKLFGLSRVQKAAPGKKSLSSEFAKKNLAANRKIGKSR